jgi:hypothetical protein
MSQQRRLKRISSTNGWHLWILHRHLKSGAQIEKLGGWDVLLFSLYKLASQDRPFEEQSSVVTTAEANVRTTRDRKKVEITRNFDPLPASNASIFESFTLFGSVASGSASAHTLRLIFIGVERKIEFVIDIHAIIAYTIIININILHIAVYGT